MSKYLLVGGGAIVALMLLVGGFSWYVASRVVGRSTRPLVVQAAQIAATHEDIAFSALDGVSLQGWLFRGTGDRLVVFVAGYGNNRGNEDYGQPALARDFLARGYSVLLYDARGTGSSGGHITQGVAEWQDAAGALRFAQTQGFILPRIALIGDSMGATTLANAVGKAAFGDVGAIILDSPAEDFARIVSFSLARDQHVPVLFHPLIFAIARYVYGTNIASVRPIDHIADDPHRQLLFLHAVHDTLIPVQNSRDLVAKAPAGSKLVEFPQGEHVQTYLQNPDLYRQSVFPFLDQQLSR